jgi:phage tail sheath gpL-like
MSFSSALAFKYFPWQFWRPSGVNAEFDPSQANTAVQNQRALLIGQITSSGTATANIAVQGYNQAQVNGLCGINSMLALKYAAYRLQDPFGEVWLGPLADAGGGTAAAGAISFTGPATAAGTFPLYLMGVSIPVAVSDGDTAQTIATNTTAAITAAVGVSCTAAIDGTDNYKVDLTALHKGLAQNDIDIRVAYLGAQNGEQVPAGVGYTVTAFTGGATNPTLTTLLSNLGTQLFDYIALPYTDVTSLNALQAFLSDQSGRWAAINMLYGHVFSAFRGTVSARTTFGTSRNDQHASILGYYDSPTPAWLEASDWCAAHVIRLRVNPAQGVSTQALNLLPPPIASQDDPGERNTLLFDGMSTFTVDAAGVCRIDRSITTYQSNASGQPDNSYLNTNIMFQAMYAARYIAAQITSQYIAAGAILVSNGTIIPPGSPATTPNLMLGSVIAIYAYLASIFIVQNVQTFAQNATAGPGTKGQVLMYLPIDFSDQVVNVGLLIQFRQST